MEQSDLQDVYEEAEVKQALATYQQVRRALQEQKNAREYYPTEKPKGKGKGSGKKGGGKGAGTRIHVSMLSCARVAQDAAKSAIGPPNAPTRLMDIASLGARPHQHRARRREAQAARPGSIRPRELVIRALSGVKSRC